MSAPIPANVRFEHHQNGLGVGCAAPRLSWRFQSTRETAQGWKQTSYEVEITRSNEKQIYRVDNDESVLVPWPAEPLSSREAAIVRVRCFGKSDSNGTTESAWSAESRVEAALLSIKDWKADFITKATRQESDGPLRPLRFRKQFAIPSDFGEVTRARLYITALGVFEPYLNGVRVSDELMAPGWTSYHHRLNYRTLDVTGALRADAENMIAVEAAEGWYAGRLGFKGGKRFCYGGNEIAILAQLVVNAADGRTWSLSTDGSWSCEESAILQSELYDGETYDATKERTSWNMVTDQAPASSAKTIAWPRAELIAPDAPPVRVTEEIKPIQLIHTPSGKTVLDFGQNLVGKILVKALKGPPGHRVQFKHAEVLEHGELGTRPLRFAQNTDTVICHGSVLQDWTPRFTFHGFRYMQVDGWPEDAGEVDLQNFVALVMHTDMERTGYFECSNSHLNKLHQNALWSMRGNFLSIPTDCPQRDERLGWTGVSKIRFKG
jgi:alpha-L-rhamnosidase